MANTRRQIAAHLAGFQDLQALKLAVWEWVNSSDGSLTAFAKVLAIHRDQPELTEAEWQQLQQQGLAFDSDSASRAEDMQRLQRYQETGESIPHDQVAAWLSSIGR
ncbi:MAG: hypothetical protein KME07_04675 [Pegethrix bostrychoides GSE-TBD4-15B]|jgi:hypothetical protein|uniref:Uncharacterized protein n=1 Tax=Pegethrix bostrychoides GSE-TBD4-15B TaxID=2839662 RepID=A0A951P8H3_9CYAN|nr:hypothetical protein [Pegethrix bostrychoides GSE-TBD4-15B]